MKFGCQRSSRAAAAEGPENVIFRRLPTAWTARRGCRIGAGTKGELGVGGAGVGRDQGGNVVRAAFEERAGATGGDNGTAGMPVVERQDDSGGTEGGGHLLAIALGSVPDQDDRGLDL